MIPDFNKKQITTVKKKLKESHRIAIVTHPRPDGDAIGSSLGMWHFLKSLGKHCTVIVPNDYPEFLKWMDGCDKIVNYDYHKEKADSILLKAEIIFVLDYNDLSRSEKMQNILSQSKAFKVMIDHHQNPKDFCDLTFSFPAAGSTAELVYEFVQQIETRYVLTKSAAECIYSGIMTDTGSFRFSSTTGDTHRIVAKLLDAGVIPNSIHENIFDNYSEKRMHLLGFCLLKKMKVIPELNTAYIALSNNDLKLHHYKQGDTEGLVNFPLSIKGIRFSVLICEQDRMVKMSFRSQGSFKVNEFASRYFNGGGHNNAAGGRSDVSLRQTVAKFLKVLPEYKKELTN